METLEDVSEPVTVMEDRELKKLLLETCPVRPGQEDRAWTSLRERLYAQPARSGWGSLLQPTWRNGAIAGVAVGLIVGEFAVVVVSVTEYNLAFGHKQYSRLYI